MYNRDDWKIEEFPSSFPSFPQGYLGQRERMTLSGLQCEVCVLNFYGLKVKVSGFRVGFVKFMSDLLDVID